MVRNDLTAAESESVTLDAGGPVFLDFHTAGRHSSLTHAAQAGVPLPVIQNLAGHSSPVVRIGSKKGQAAAFGS